MNIDIAALNFELTRALKAHILRRIRLALAPAPGRVAGAMVRLRDVNGPRGGVDKGCRMVVWLHGKGAVVIDVVERDLYVAIDLAASKLREAVRRRLRRRRTLRREHANRAGSAAGVVRM